MNQPTEIAEAIRLYKSEQPEKSRDLLHNFLLHDPVNVDALLWLAKVSPDPREALAAAELALALEPNNEIAQRAIEAVPKRFGQSAERPPIDIVRVTGLTLAQARAARWPFRFPEGSQERPIGPLLDEGVLAVKNLGYAADEARDSQMRQAARTLLLARLLEGQIKEPPAPVKVIEGSGYTAYQERRWMILSGLSLGALIMVAVFGFVLYVIGNTLASVNKIIAGGLVVIGLALSGIAYVGMKISDDYNNRSRNYRQGREAEGQVIDALRASLSSPWVIVHNMEWLERKWGDVDIVVIGPGGVWAMEVKAYRHPVRNVGDRWQYKSRWGWRNLSRHPGEQARRNAANVRKYLEANGISLKWVDAVVVWAGDDNTLTLDDPATPVWRVSEIADRVEEFWREGRLSADQVQQAASILENAVEKVKAKDTAKSKKSHS